MAQYPQREGEPDCRDFLRTGRCKYGESCKYHHPIGGIKAPSDPSEPPFPIRPNEPPCQYFLKHGTCKFGQTCKFHHPTHILSTGGSGLSNAVLMNVGGMNLLTKPGSQNGILLNTGTGENTLSPNEFQQSGTLVQVLPQRPNEPDCIYFLRNGRCKYGATCKYHHPTNAHGHETNSAGKQQVQMHFQSRNGRGRSISTGSMMEAGNMGTIQFLSPHANGNGHGFYGQRQRMRQQNEGDGNSSAHILVADGPISVMTLNKSFRTSNSSYHHGNMNNLNVEGFIQNPQDAVDFSGTANKNGQYNQNDLPSPTMGSPTITSSTIASSYDTVTSGFDFLPGSSQVHNNSNYQSQTQSEHNGSLWRRNYSQPQLSANDNDNSHVGVFHSKSAGRVPVTDSKSHFCSQIQRNESGEDQEGSQHSMSSLRRAVEANKVNRNTGQHQNLQQYRPGPNTSDRVGNYSGRKMVESHYVQNDMRRGWPSSASLNSSNGGDRPWEENSAKQSQDYVQEDTFVKHLSSSAPTSSSGLMNVNRYDEVPPPAHLGYGYGNVGNRTRQNQIRHFDDGLSMMTSALLTMLDTQDEEGEGNDSFENGNEDDDHINANSQYLYHSSPTKHDVGKMPQASDNLERSHNGLKSESLFLKESSVSSTHISSHVPSNTGAAPPPGLSNNDSLQHGGGMFKSLSFGDEEDHRSRKISPTWSPTWNGVHTSGGHELERNAQSVSALQGAPTAPHSAQLFLS